MTPPKDDWEKGYHKSTNQEKEKISALEESDIALLKIYGKGPYSDEIKKIEKNISEILKRVEEKVGVKELDTGLAPPNVWDIAADKRRVQEEQTLQVARCTKIIERPEEKQYVINVKQIGKFVVGLGKKVSPSDIEEGIRVG